MNFSLHPIVVNIVVRNVQVASRVDLHNTKIENFQVLLSTFDVFVSTYHVSRFSLINSQILFRSNEWKIEIIKPNPFWELYTAW